MKICICKAFCGSKFLSLDPQVDWGQDYYSHFEEEKIEAQSLSDELKVTQLKWKCWGSMSSLSIPRSVLLHTQSHQGRNCS